MACLGLPRYRPPQNRPVLEIPVHRLLFLLVPCALIACEPQATSRTPGDMPTKGTPIATVGNGTVTQEMLDSTLARIPETQREQMEQAGQMDQVKESLFIGELLYQDALAAGLHKDPSIQVSLALAERSALAEAYIEKKIEEGVTDARIQQYYDDHKVQYAQEQAKLRIMVLPDEATATEVKTALDGGGDFTALAKEKSEDAKTKDAGGDLGWVEKKSLPPDFSTPIFAAEKGAIVGPLAAGPRQLIFKVEDRRDATPLEEVKDQVKEALKSEIAQELVTEMRDKAKAAMTGGEGKATVTAPAPGAAPAGAAPAGAAPAGGAPAADPHDH
jgi:parvulin-like peptidyl-prolyl isomerase